MNCHNGPAMAELRSNQFTLRQLFVVMTIWALLLERPDVAGSIPSLRVRLCGRQYLHRLRHVLPPRLADSPWRRACLRTNIPGLLIEIIRVVP